MCCSLSGNKRSAGADNNKNDASLYRNYTNNDGSGSGDTVSSLSAKTTVQNNNIHPQHESPTVQHNNIPNHNNNNTPIHNTIQPTLSSQSTTSKQSHKRRLNGISGETRQWSAGSCDQSTNNNVDTVAQSADEILLQTALDSTNIWSTLFENNLIDESGEGINDGSTSPLFSAISAVSNLTYNDPSLIFANGDGEDDVDELDIAIEVENNDNTKKRRPMIIDRILPTGEKSSAQLIAEGALITRLGSIVTKLVDTGCGDTIMPKGLMWDDINLNHPKITQLWDVKQAGALVYYHELSNKGGYSRHPQSRYLLGYKKLETSESKSPIPILANIHNQCAITHRLLTDEMTKLFKDYGSEIGPFVNAKCQEAIDNEKVSVPFYFTLTCQIMTLLEGIEPRTIREIFMGLVIESGLQDLCDLDQKSAVHEPFTKTSLSRSMKDHAEDAVIGNGFFNHVEFNAEERMYMSTEEIQMTALVSYPPGVKGTRISHIGPDTEFPSLTVLITRAMLNARNTADRVVMMDVMSKPPPGNDPYKVYAYPDEDIIHGYSNVWLPQLEMFLQSSERVSIKCIDTFAHMWRVMAKETSELFVEVLNSDEWKEIDTKFSRYGIGLNAIKFLIYRGFKPFWHPTKCITGLVMRVEGKLRVIFVYRPVCWIGHSGPLKNKDGTPLSSSAALGALFDQANRANGPYIFSLMSRQLQQPNASLNISTNLGDFPIAGNVLIARDLRKYGGLCLHGDKKLATSLMKFVLAGDVDLIRLHRLVFPNGNCEIVSHALRRGEGPSSAKDPWWFIAFVAELAAPRNGTKKEAVARAFKCLCRDRAADGDKQHTYIAIYERYMKLIGEEYNGAFSGEVLKLLQIEWQSTRHTLVKPTPDQSVKQCARCNVSKRKMGNFRGEELRKDEGICISCEIKEEMNKSNELQQQLQQQQQQQAKVEKLESLLAMDTQQKKATKSKNASIEKIVSAQNEERSVMNMWKAAKDELKQLRTALKVEEDEEKKAELSVRIDEVKERKEELMTKL